MPTTILEPISTVTSPESKQESEFELDIRISSSLSDPEPTNAGTYTCSATNCSNCCPPSSESVWYLWCCN